MLQLASPGMPQMNAAGARRLLTRSGTMLPPEICTVVTSRGSDAIMNVARLPIE